MITPKVYIPSTINIWKMVPTKAIWADKKISPYINKSWIFNLIQNVFTPTKLESENNKPWFQPWINVLHNQLCATVDSQCLEYLGYITLDNASSALWFSTLLFFAKKSFRRRKSDNRVWLRGQINLSTLQMSYMQ